MEEEKIDNQEEGIDLHEEYQKKTDEMKKKYEEVINEISIKRNVPVSDAFDMLKAICRGGEYGEELEAKLDLDELKNDYFELCGISEQIAKANGLI